MFLNRLDELTSLKERFSGSSAEMVIIYGRRRVGKSELIDQFIGNFSGIRILAREETKDLQLKQVSSELISLYEDKHLKTIIFPDWDGIFSYIRSHAEERTILAFDEFPYLVKEDPSLPSILQYHWDTWLKDSRVFLILSGSSISMMEELTMQYKSPLFGRRTGQYLIRPLRFTHILEYCQDMKQAVELYAVFGGTPAYILKADIQKDIFENILTKILVEDSVLFRDTEFVLRTEVSEPRYYFSILRAIAEGQVTSSKIAQNTGLERSTVSKYLQTLMDLHLIRREIPAGESDKSKKGQYFLSDNYFSFWFRFVYPYSKTVEMGRGTDLVHHQIKPFFSPYVGRIFEDCIRDLLWDFNTRGLLPFTFVECSRWWYKEDEIDLIATNKKQFLFCEVKWQDDVNAIDVHSRLLVKAEKFLAYQGIEKDGEGIYNLIIARSFYHPDKTLGNNILLWDIGDMSSMFFNGKP